MGLFIMWPRRCLLTTCKLKLIFSLVVLNVHKQISLFDITNLKLILLFECNFLFSVKVGSS